MARPAREKRRRVVDALTDRSLAELWCCRPANVAWLAGGTTVVDAASEVGVAAPIVLVDDGLEVLTATDGWPTTRYDAVGFDESAAFHDPLERDG